MKTVRKAVAFAPAGVGNVAVGFDLLGFPIEGVGDWVTVTETDRPGVELGEVTGIVTELPRDPALNTATAGLVQLARDLGLSRGYSVSIKKGIPLGSGMGGSAASAVGGLVALNSLLEQPLSKERLLKYALIGESVASGSAHADNIAPLIFGGLTLALPHEMQVIRIPVPKTIQCVLVHPHIRVDTRDARKILRREVELEAFVRQAGYLAAFISGCHGGNLELIRTSLRDLVIEPQRSRLIPGFDSVKEAALEAGALGCSISGSGPSVFAWVESEQKGLQVKELMLAAFRGAGIREVDGWISPVSREGARVVANEVLQHP